jgi:hypothetical protein
VTTNGAPVAGDSLHPAARKLLIALAQHAPARFTWGQAATLAGLKPSGGHFNAGRKSLRESGYIEEANDLLSASPIGLKAVGEVPPAPSTPAERLALWCDRLPSPAPEMLRTLAAQGERYMDAAELAAVLGKKPSGGHWNSGVAVLRNNGLIETDGRRYRSAALFREVMKTSGRLGAILSDLIGPILLQTRLGQDCPSRDKRGQPHTKCGWQDRRCWPTTRCLTRPRLDSDLTALRALTSYGMSVIILPYI